MSNHNLIASLALFGELYDSNKIIKDIIGDFVLNVIRLKNAFHCNSVDIKRMLKEEYCFDIPESVIKTTLNRLQNKGEVEKKNGGYQFKKKNTNEPTEFKNELQKTIELQKEIFEKLCLFVEEQEKKSLTDDEKNSLFKDLIAYLLDQSLGEKYKSSISAFIILNQNEEKIKNALQYIKEGVILYQGITYTPNINNLGSWNNTLTIYLATEHLFSAVGYNGELYQEIFNDFLSLVNEINSNNKKQKIRLVYGDEVKMETDNFFSSAENIIKGRITPDVSSSAMKSILKDCYRPSDIVNKKSNFIEELKGKGIKQIHNIEILPEYNVEDLSVVEEVIKNSKREIKEEECLDILKIFSQINTRRGGRKSNSFEQSGYIYMVESALANYLAHQLEVKIKQEDFPYAKNIDFITTQFWFKLNKGFGLKNQSLPKSFSFITKAQLILSNYINKSIEDRYNETKEKFKRGDISQENLILLKKELENESKNPEDITFENIDSTFEFLTDDNYLDKVIRENSHKDDKLKSFRIENEKLKIYKEKNETLKKKKQLNKKAKEYAQEEWKKKQKEDRQNICYFVIWLSINIIIFGLGLAGGIFTIAQQFGLPDWLSWMGLTLLIPLGIFQKCKMDFDKFKAGGKTIRKYMNYKKYKIRTLIKSKDSFLKKTHN